MSGIPGQLCAESLGATLGTVNGGNCLVLAILGHISIPAVVNVAIIIIAETTIVLFLIIFNVLPVFVYGKEIVD